MILKQFTIERFRIFSQQQVIHFSEFSVLVGPNNEGKTTACDALEIYFRAMKCCQKEERSLMYGRRFRSRPRTTYSPKRDYPLSLKEGKKGRRWPTTFEATFELNAKETETLLGLGITTKGNLSIVLKWDYKLERLIFSVPGLPQGSTDKVLQFMQGHFRYITVPAIRDDVTLNDNLSSLFREAIDAVLERSRKIQKLQSNLETTIAPEIGKITKALQNSVKELLPSIRDVEFDWAINLDRSIEIRDINVDDGLKTSINLKGDGIKSLVVLAQLTHLATLTADPSEAGRTRFFVIEEPESHLNSSFLYTLRNKLRELSNGNLVLVTTHSPVFVDFSNTKSVNLVTGGAIKRPKKKLDIAEALGVQIGENLRSNSICILCEGVEDEIALKTILEKRGNKSLLQQIDIVPAHGAGNIPLFHASHGHFFRRTFAVADNDDPGNSAFEILRKQGLSDGDLWLCPKEPGFKTAELEDLVSVAKIVEILTSYFQRQFDLQAAEAMKSRYKAKFSDWIVPFVNYAGLPLSDKNAIKRAIWDGISKDASLVLSSTGTSFFDSLVKTVEQHLAGLN